MNIKIDKEQIKRVVRKFNNHYDWFELKINEDFGTIFIDIWSKNSERIESKFGHISDFETFIYPNNELCDYIKKETFIYPNKIGVEISLPKITDENIELIIMDKLVEKFHPKNNGIRVIYPNDEQE